jgi:predicted nucleic acid-binding protein
MLVVADASPLIFLGRLGLLDLLPNLYGRVLVPEAVFREATRGGENLPGSTAIRVADWIEVVPGESDPDLRQALEEHLDKGEAAAIALAQSVEADLLLIDERQGRRVPGEAGEAVREKCRRCGSRPRRPPGPSAHGGSRGQPEGGALAASTRAAPLEMVPGARLDFRRRRRGFQQKSETDHQKGLRLLLLSLLRNRAEPYARAAPGSENYPQILLKTLNGR